jgi:hypothetical protein
MSNLRGTKQGLQKRMRNKNYQRSEKMLKKKNRRIHKNALAWQR